MTNTKQKDWEEEFASAIHEQWSHWQKYLHTKLIPSEHEGIWNISEALIQKWHSQMNTPYSELTEEEKQSDIDIYKKFYEPIVLSLLTQQKKEIVEMISKLVKTTNLVGLTGESAIFANEYNKALIDVLDILQANLLTKE